MLVYYQGKLGPTGALEYRNLKVEIGKGRVKDITWLTAETPLRQAAGFYRATLLADVAKARGVRADLIARCPGLTLATHDGKQVVVHDGSTDLRIRFFCELHGAGLIAPSPKKATEVGTATKEKGS